MAKNPQPQLPKSTGTGIRGIPGTSAEAVKIPLLPLLLSPFASLTEPPIHTRTHTKSLDTNDNGPSLADPYVLQ